MIIKKYFFAAASPRALREFALNHSVFFALTVNTLTGILTLPIATLPLLNTLSIPLLLLLAVLFGPFPSLLVSSVYPLIEYWVGRKLGSKTSFDDLFRIFAWSFFPVGLVSMLSWLVIIFMQNTLGDISRLVTMTPLLFALFFSVLFYCFNVFSSHQLSKTKGVVSMLTTFILFIFIPTTIIVLILLTVQTIKQYLARHRSENVMAGEVIFTNFRKAAVAIVFFYAVLFSWIVVYDDKLDPPVAKALGTPLPDIFYLDNSWPALLAFTSATGGPPFVEEETRLRAIRATLTEDDGTTCDRNAAMAEHPKELSFLGKLPEFYTRRDNGIWKYGSAHPAEVDKLCRDNSDLLHRYDDLYNYHQFTEPLDCGYSTPVPHFSPLRSIQKVKLLQIARTAQTAQTTRGGDFRGALLEVQKDAEFWRLVAGESKTLINKLVALSMLATDFQLVAELGLQQQPDPDEWQLMQAILRPFDQGESSFAGTLNGEAIFSLLSFKALAREAKKDPLVNSALLKPNATRNGIYSYYQKAIALAEMSPPNFASSAALLEDAGSPISNWSFIYNPIGEILNNIARPNIAEYIERGHKIECLRRLALLKILSVKERIAPKNMQQFLDTYKADYGNPYTGESMNWDAQQNKIFIKQILEEKDVEIYL
jgi:hypothetical protein